MVEEALFNLEFYRALQTPEGGIRGGIESDELPLHGECSWQESLKSYAYAPDAWSSYIYAGVAANLAHVLEKHLPNHDRRSDFRTSAIRAFEWAEHEWARQLTEGEADRCTNQAKVEMSCQRALESTAGNSWRISVKYQPAIRDSTEETALLAQGRIPIQYGTFSLPSPESLLRAHWLSGHSRFLAAAIAGAQFPAGANPDNRAFVSGMGHDPVVHVQDWDSKITAQDVPEGITVHGIVDIPYRRQQAEAEQNAASSGFQPNPNWFTGTPKYFLDKQCTPGIYEWPMTESFCDVGHWGASTEYTPHHTLGPAAYTWGYLALAQR